MKEFTLSYSSVYPNVCFFFLNKLKRINAVFMLCSTLDYLTP
ncbi:unnamed protein product [Brugia timori]|uniref:Uncharacterized protein n=1 Tax=Brugia timori TaxID=42155 RepID=A0A0R3QZC4_9BILA|nr:unnamed protein product [Brugia timori]